MEKNSRPTITIKLKPYLQEYLRSELRNQNIASKRNIIGKIIRPFLVIRPAGVNPEFSKSSDYITFELPYYEDMNILNNLYITPENQKIIEGFLELHFKDLFYHYMKDKVRFYRSFKKCILQFCADHNLTFDYINYEMLKKDFYRRRKEEDTSRECLQSDKKSLSGFVPEMSLECPRNVPDNSLHPTCVFLI